MLDNKMITKKQTEMIMILHRNNILRKVHISKLAKKSNVTHSHARLIINILEERSLLTTSKIGRKRFVQLTRKGTVFCENLEKVRGAWG